VLETPLVYLGVKWLRPAARKTAGAAQVAEATA